MVDKSVCKFRLLLLAIIPVIIVFAFATRSGSALIPTFIAKYGGDTLWALMVFLVIRFLAHRLNPFRSAIIALVIAYLGEISQLYHAPWIDAIRSYRLGGVILGFGFLWSDLVCYTVGIFSGAIVEWSLRKWQYFSRLQ
jgi:hypothetical protein